MDEGLVRRFNEGIACAALHTMVIKYVFDNGIEATVGTEAVTSMRMKSAVHVETVASSKFEHQSVFKSELLISDGI